jgi:hypothetical protein
VLPRKYSLRFSYNIFAFSTTPRTTTIQNDLTTNQKPSEKEKGKVEGLDTYLEH